MKYTKKKLAYFMLETLFSLVVPVVLTVHECMTCSSARVRIGVFGAAVALIAYYAVKRLFIDKRIAELKGKIVHLKSELIIETDAAKIVNIEKALGRAQALEVVTSSIVPIGLLAVFFFVAKSVEAGLANFAGTVGFILLSAVVGSVFAVLNALTVASKNRSGNNENG